MNIINYNILLKLTYLLDVNIATLRHIKNRNLGKQASKKVPKKALNKNLVKKAPAFFFFCE